MKSLSFGNKILFFINNIFALLLIVAYLTTFISPLVFKYSALINFAIPFLWIVNGLFILIWSIKLKKQILLSTIVILLGWFHFKNIYAVNNVHKQLAGGFKVMSYNVMQFYSKNDKRKSTYNDIYDFVNVQNPDIICMQEYNKFKHSLFPDYNYRTENNTSNALKTIILSRYPIIDEMHFGFGVSNNSAVYADIVKEQDTLRFFSIHFESLNLKSSIKKINDQPKDKFVNRLGKTFKRQIEQLNTLKPYIENSPYPVIIGADMNNTGLSYMYKELLNLNLKDTFLESGQNYGETYKFGILPIRIDMILINENLTSSDFKNYNVDHSDHFPIMTEIHL